MVARASVAQDGSSSVIRLHGILDLFHGKILRDIQIWVKKYSDARKPKDKII
jgi:hypothetical protein